MRFTPITLKDAVLIDIEKRSDPRGWFARLFCEEEFAAAGLATRFVQANASANPRAGTLRGMHFQYSPHAEVKVVRCTRGAIFDAIIDLRPNSPTYRQWEGFELTVENGRMLYVPEGFAHGYQTLEDDSEVSYLVSYPYTPGAEGGLRYDDPAFAIAWPRAGHGGLRQGRRLAAVPPRRRLTGAGAVVKLDGSPNLAVPVPESGSRRRRRRPPRSGTCRRPRRGGASDGCSRGVTKTAGFAVRGVTQAARRGRARLQRSAMARLRDAGLSRPDRLLGPLKAARRLLPSRLFLAQAEALLTARARGWAAAAPLFARIADPAARPVLTGSPATSMLRPAVPARAIALAIPARDRPSFVPEAEAGRTVVYTAIFGRAQALAPAFGIADRVRFLCFTDQPVSAPGWRILPPAVPAGDPAAAAAFHKIRAAEVLGQAAPDAEASLWLDPDRTLLGNPDTLLTRWLLPQDLALWRNPASDWPDMAERHLVHGTAPAAAVLAQAGRFAAEAVPGRRGGCDTGMIWRRHAAPGMAALTEAWWRSWTEAPGADDLALYRALHAPEPAPIRPAILPARLGSAADNIFVARSAPRPVRPRPRPRSAGRLPIAFLSAAPRAKSASTFLRGRQLSAMVAAAYPETYDVRFTEDAAGLRDAVVVLTKGAMATLTVDEIAALGRRSIATIGCWDDIRPNPEKARLVDAHMTLAHRQTLDLNRLFPETPAFLVTHHVNTQVPRGTPPEDRLRTGYFGDLGNTVRPETLAGMIDLVGIDTRDVNDNWLTALPHYNCHWIVRRKRPWDAWKPFLKGFVAARCGAVVIVAADDGDAPYYLGDDYPFYARSVAPPDLEMAMAGVAAAFGGPDWHRARDIMAQVAARSTDAQVCAEFRAMIDEVTR